jgi:hypothetical protein
MGVEKTDLEGVLDFKTLSATVEMYAYTPSELVALFPTRNIQGHKAAWDVFRHGRGVAALNTRDGRSYSGPLRPVAAKDSQCVYLSDSRVLPGDLFNALRDIGSRERNVRAAVTRELTDIRDSHRRTREFLMSQALSGALTLTIAGVSLAVDFGMAATHTGAGATAAVSWNTISTDIIADIETWKARVRQDSGMEPTEAFMNQSVMAYLLKNTAIQKFLGAAQYAVQVGQEGKLIRLAGLNLHQVDDGYVTAAGVFTPWVANDKFIITPPASGKWAETQVGEVAVIASGSLVNVQAPGAYFLTEGDAPADKVIERDCFLPVLLVPDAVVYADVTP